MELTQENLKKGLDMVGKGLLSTPEWNGKFAQMQNQHFKAKDRARSKVGKNMLKRLDNFGYNIKECHLCFHEKPKSQFLHLCACCHEYCYSCLNSYAISKIEELSPVLCPQQNCGERMIMGSKVYRYLPDKIKLKYLTNKNKFLINDKKLQEKCQRCLEDRHLGPCKYSYQPKIIDDTFKHRECPNCANEIRLATGSKKVKCEKCSYVMCYICGQKWVDTTNKRHVCGMRKDVTDLQGRQCLDCEGQCCQCCECCQCDCSYDACRKCQGNFCSDILFNCEQGSLPCAFINICCLPSRLVLSVLSVVLVGFFMIPVLFSCMGWIVVSLLAGFFSFPCELIGQNPFLVIVCPFLGLIGFFFMLCELIEMPLNSLEENVSLYCSCFICIWIDLSPKEMMMD